MFLGQIGVELKARLSQLAWAADEHSRIGLVVLLLVLLYGLTLALLPLLFSVQLDPILSLAGWLLFGGASIWSGYRLRDILQPEPAYWQLIQLHHQLIHETANQDILLDRLVETLFKRLRPRHLSLWRYRSQEMILTLARVRGKRLRFTELPVDIDLSQVYGIRSGFDLPESALRRGLLAAGIDTIAWLSLGDELIGLIGLEEDRFGGRSSQEAHHCLDFIAGQLALAVKNAYLITDLEDALGKLQLAYRRTVDAEEDQRRHLAVELHDDILSRLTMMALTLRNCRKQSPPSPVQGWLDLLEKEAQSLSGRLREITQGLYPSVLADLGLISALQAYLDSLAKRPGSVLVSCAVTLTAQGFNGDRLEQQKLERDLYYIARQSLDNALTHAQAEQVFVHLRWRKETVSLTVQDTGCGMKEEPETLMGQNGRLGLLSMNERVLAWQGQLTFRTAPGRGTTVHARLPVDQPSPAPTHLQAFSHLLQPNQVTESPVER